MTRLARVTRNVSPCAVATTANNEQSIDTMAMALVAKTGIGWTSIPGMVQNGVRHRCAKHPSGRSGNGAWFKMGSGTVVRSTLRAVPATVPDPFLNHGQFAYQTAAGVVQFHVDDLPNVVEQESNDSRDVAMKLSVPQTVNGRCWNKTDDDWFQFKAGQDGRFTITCFAYPPGTAALPTILLADEDGRQLAKSASVDAADGLCQIEWKSPMSGTYFLRVRDVQYGARGGPEFIYRLSVRESQPDFAISVKSDCINVVQGQKASLELTVRRFGGFEGPIELALQGLPEGVQIENPQVPEKKSNVSVNLTATEDVPASSVTLTLIGRATIDGKPTTRIAHARHLGVDSEGVSVASSTLDRLHLTVKHKPVFRLFCPEAYQYAHRGSIFPYPMEIERLDGFNEPITLEIGDRQNRDLDGIEMIPVVIPPGETETFLPIYLPETMHINVGELGCSSDPAS